MLSLRLKKAAVLAAAGVLAATAGAPVSLAQDVAAAPPSSGGDLFPPNAQPGECYARVFVPPTYETSTDQLLKREASERLEITPAKYEWTTEQVLVREPSQRLEVLPAQFETVTETVVVEPARTVWRLGKGSKAPVADSTLLAEAQKLGAAIGSAQPGQCFAEYLSPERHETQTEQVLKKAASSRIEVVPAKYDYVEERVLVQEASTKLVEVPAQYETVTEKVLDRPAHTIWKRGRGPIERVDNLTGEIMCLVEVPATYKTVRKRVLKAPATTRTVEIPARYETVKVRKLVAAPQERRVEIPAEYQTVSRRAKVSDAVRSWNVAGAGPGANAGPGAKATGRRLCLEGKPERTRTVTKRVEKAPASTRSAEIPGEYKTVKVRKLVQPATTRRIEIPAEYQTVTKRTLLRDGRMDWRPILCETNASPALVTNIQRALKTAGHNPGPIDGRIGSQTLSAVRSFQRAKGLPEGHLTVSTIKALGVPMR